MPLKKMKNDEYIYARLAADGRVTSFQVKIRKSGFPDFSGSFQKLEMVKAKVRSILHDHYYGDRTDHGTAKKITLREVLEKAKTDLELGRFERADSSSDIGRLNRFLRDEAICDFALVNLGEASWQDYILERSDSVKPAAIKRELNTIRPFVGRACALLKIRDALNGVKSPRILDTEVARINYKDEQNIFLALKMQQNSMTYQAAVFSIETGIRRGELLRLKWCNYDGAQGTVWLQRGKNGDGRYILLTRKAQSILENLPTANSGENMIFDLTAETIKQGFERARKIANAEHVNWHHMRHEAISRCFEAGWGIEQVKDFSGHKDIASLLRYRHIHVADKVRKLRELEAMRDRQNRHVDLYA